MRIRKFKPKGFQDVESNCKEQITLFWRPNYLGCIDDGGERVSTAKFYILHKGSQKHTQKDNFKKKSLNFLKSYKKKDHTKNLAYFCVILNLHSACVEWSL